MAVLGGGGMGHMANLALSVGGLGPQGAAKPGLSTGRLAHPAAQRAAMMAGVGRQGGSGLKIRDSDTESQAGAELSAPEEEDEDFWG